MTAPAIEIEADFPEKLQFLFKPHRYKVARGGRGSGKSWSFARALLILGGMKKMRVLCAREVQLSIRQSVHKLLKDQIQLMGMESFYTIMESEIRGKNGTEINFTGLSTMTVDAIKSFESIDVCWVEEGQVITKRSWDILSPTIRKTDSEIWISYNPDLESDETHQRFTANPPTDCVNELINWRDNPWFNAVLDQERLHCQQHMPDDYDNIWEGKRRPAVSGAIYYKEMSRAIDEGRLCNVPHDPLLKTHIVYDLGRGDNMAISMVQRHLSEIRIIDYYDGYQETLEDYSNELKKKEYNWGRVWLPHDGYAKRVNMGVSSYDVLTAQGWDVVTREEIVEQSVEEGIRMTRLKFGQFYFDEHKCASLIESVKRYRRHLNQKIESFGNPIHDKYSHGADCLRYIALNADNMRNEDLEVFEPPNLGSYGHKDGWMV